MFDNSGQGFGAVAGSQRTKHQGNSTIHLWPTKTVRVLRATSSPAIDLKLYSPIAPQALVCALQKTPPGLWDTTTHVHTPAIQTREAALMQA